MNEKKIKVYQVPTAFTKTKTEPISDSSSDRERETRAHDLESGSSNLTDESNSGEKSSEEDRDEKQNSSSDADDCGGSMIPPSPILTESEPNSPEVSDSSYSSVIRVKRRDQKAARKVEAQVGKIKVEKSFWSPEESERYFEAIRLFGLDYEKIYPHVGTKSLH